jgi:2-oxoglutarate dehydrogenase E1 component
MTGLLDKTSFLTSANSTFVAELYARYLEKPAAVDPEWAAFFDELQDEAPDVLKDLRGASWAPNGTAVIGTETAAEVLKTNGAKGHAANGAAPVQVLSDATRDSIQALMIIRSHRVRGHLYAELDPLGLEQPLSHTELDPESYGFSEADYDRDIYIHDRLGLGEKAPLMTSTEEKVWIQDRIEGIRNQTDFTDIGKITILERLTEAETFEQFLNVKYTGTKRFGLDGAESLVPGLEQILKRGTQLGVEEVVIGMPHRGRLNVLANVMNKPFAAIFSEFQGMSAKPEDVQGSGDVKYHLGTSADR